VTSTGRGAAIGKFSCDTRERARILPMRRKRLCGSVEVGHQRKVPGWQSIREEACELSVYGSPFDSGFAMEAEIPQREVEQLHGCFV
jgi:hypothetical protein